MSLRISRRFIRVAGLFIFLSSSAAVTAQLTAPGAFDDFVGCGNRGCVWVPHSTHKTFRQSGLTYTVETAGYGDIGGSFVLRRGSRELLRTPLKDLSASVSVLWSEDDRNFAIGVFT